MAKARIMLVEDEGIIAHFTQYLLENEGYEVVTIAYSGEQALEQIPNANIDLILMDIELAGEMDGIETAKQIYTHYHIPLIYMSSHLDAETLQRVKSTYPFAYLIKPVQEIELIITVQIALNRYDIENNYLYALNEKNRLLSAFHQIARSLSSSLDLDHILDTLVEQIVNAGIFRSLMVALVDESTHSVEVVRALTRVGAKGELHSPYVEADNVGIRFSLDDEDSTPEVVRTGRMKVIEGTDERFDRPNKYTHKMLKSEERIGQVFYFIPIKKNNQVVAVVATGSSATEKEEILHRIRIMQPLLDQAAIALDHAKLYHSLQKRTADIEKVNKKLHNEILERNKAEASLKREYLLREAETKIRVRVASISH